jgi:teichuronic acid biosynthesis glycosyltransferase TuaG
MFILAFLQYLMELENMKPETTIITPIYNAEDFLADSLDSILNQSYQDWEAILINDNSTDGSLEIAQRFTQLDSRFKIINQSESGGAAKARNSGIEAAKGRFIAFLDSDDIWLPEKLNEQISFMKSNDIDFSFTAYNFISEKGVLGDFVTVPNEVSYKTLLRGNIIACLTAVYDTKKLGKVYMPDILKRQDFALWLKITKTGVNAVGINESFAHYRLRTGSLSSTKFNTMMHTWGVYRNVEKFSVLSSFLYISSHLAAAIKKRIKNKLRKA